MPIYIALSMYVKIHYDDVWCADADADADIAGDADTRVLRL